MEKKKLIVIGCGARGKAYASIAKEMEGCFEVVAIAEPLKERREHLQKLWNLPEERCFSSWEPLLALPRLADAAVIATMDRDHTAPAMKAIEKGYHLLLEKPVSPVPEECFAIERAANLRGVEVLVCHVLRYTPFFRAVKRVIDSGMLGEVVNIQHTEGVGNLHQSHSFVRGNWKNSQESSFMLLQKSCHDMDILAWLVGKPCLRAQSFGSLTYFREENAPKGAPERCMDGCPVGESCRFNAVRLYLDDKKNGWFRGAATRMPSPTDADVEHALRTTEYGKCVFRCSNDVVDHQVVNLEFEGGVTASFTMSAFCRGTRTIRVMGTEGELTAEMKNPMLGILRFGEKEYQEIPVSDMVTDDSIVGGHGGGDQGIMHAFYELLCGRRASGVCDIGETCRNHMIAFAAERSRLEGRVVCLSEYEDEGEKQWKEKN